MIRLLQHDVTDNARRYPNALMIQDGDAQISYDEMESWANKFARFLLSCGLQRQDPIAFLMKKSICSFKALISILKADAVYVPLNVLTPQQRNRYIIDHCRCRAVICDRDSFSQALLLLEGYLGMIIVLNPPSNDAKGMSLAGEDKKEKSHRSSKVIFANNLDQFDDTELEYQNKPDDLAYILYTSGSTGWPKGVMISHANVMDYAGWTVEFFKITKEDRLSSHPGLYFDLSVFDVYTSFKSGASLHIVPQSSSMFPIKIIEFIENNKLTLWNSVPSLLTFMAKSGILKRGRMPTLKNLTFNGEVMPTQTVIDWMTAYPHLRLVNQYGPTETTCASLFYEIKETPRDAIQPIPIGKPIPGTVVFAMTEEGKLASAGDTAELYIGGVGNGRGYIYDEEKTRKSFVQNPFTQELKDIVYATGDLARLRDDGNYDFVGRKDHQIKYMGFRVELGEIESTLNTFDYVAASAALGIEDLDVGGTKIAVFIALKRETDVAQIMDDLAQKIPHYMVPKDIVKVDRLPLNANGKIDRVRLKQNYLGISASKKVG